jgi:hypothetical protein
MRVNNPDHSSFDWRWNVATQHGRRTTMRSGERKSVIGWLLNQFMRIMPGPVTEWLINRSTERIAKAASAISLKDYSSFSRSHEAGHMMP